MSLGESLRLLDPATENLAIAQHVIKTYFPRGIKPVTFWGEGKEKNIPHTELGYAAVRAFKPLILVAPKSNLEKGLVSIHPESTGTNIIVSTPHAYFEHTMSVVARFGLTARENSYWSAYHVFDDYFEVPHYMNPNGKGSMARGFVHAVSEFGVRIQNFVEDPSRVLLHIALIGEGHVRGVSESIHGLVVLKK